MTSPLSPQTHSAWTHAPLGPIETETRLRVRPQRAPGHDRAGGSSGTGWGPLCEGLPGGTTLRPALHILSQEERSTSVVRRWPCAGRAGGQPPGHTGPGGRPPPCVSAAPSARSHPGFTACYCYHTCREVTDGFCSLCTFPRLCLLHEMLSRKRGAGAHPVLGPVLSESPQNVRDTCEMPVSNIWCESVSARWCLYATATEISMAVALISKEKGHLLLQLAPECWTFPAGAGGCRGPRPH